MIELVAARFNLESGAEAAPILATVADAERWVSRVRNAGAIPTASEGALLSPTGVLQLRHRFPVEADYDIQVGMGGRRAPDQPALSVVLLLDGREIKLYRIDPNPNTPRRFTVRAPVTAGEHQLTAAFLKDDSRPEDPARDKNVVVDFLEVRGPFDQKPRPLTDSHKRIFVCGHAPGGQRRRLGHGHRRAGARDAAREGQRGAGRHRLADVVLGPSAAGW